MSLKSKYMDVPLPFASIEISIIVSLCMHPNSGGVRIYVAACRSVQNIEWNMRVSLCGLLYNIVVRADCQR